MSESRESEASVRVHYFGPPGTFTHMAARAAFGDDARYADAGTIAGVFEAVARRQADFGVVPIENSTEGGVTFTLDSLLEIPLQIRRELILDVAQCLVGVNDDFSQIAHVYSHPQALAQCRLWLAKNLPHAGLVIAPSTSAAARDVASNPRAAAISSQLAAELAGLQVIRHGIQDREENATRFIVIAEQDAPRTGSDKTSLFFSTPHQRGALRKVLEVFDEEGINLTRIESRPAQKKRWEYVFFVDLEGHRSDPAVARALERLQAECGLLRVLGSYPRAS